MLVDGTEEGWANASFDSRRDEKQRDIRATVSAMQAASEKKRTEWEDKLGDELVEATCSAVLKGGVNCVGSIVGERPRANFDNWVASLKETT